MNNCIIPETNRPAAEAIQCALQQAVAQGLNKVVIPAGVWKIDQTILLPSQIHLVLDGAVLESTVEPVFQNENLFGVFGHIKEGRQCAITITGENSAKIHGGGILLHNVTGVTVENICTEVTLSFCHDVRVRGTDSPVTLLCGCHQVFLRDVGAVSARSLRQPYDYHFDLFEESPEISSVVLQSGKGLTLEAEGWIWHIQGAAQCRAQESDRRYNIFHIVNE